MVTNAMRRFLRFRKKIIERCCQKNISTHIHLTIVTPYTLLGAENLKATLIKFDVLLCSKKKNKVLKSVFSCNY